MLLIVWVSFNVLVLGFLLRKEPRMFHAFIASLMLVTLVLLLVSVFARV